MGSNSNNSLKSQFLDLLNDPTCVCVENFYERMENINKILVWSEKKIDWNDFNKHFNEYKPEELELYIEGYRCLAQIHINLLKDFEIFKIYPIRKYSSAYNYISKIPDYEKLLTAIDYKLIEKEKKYKLEENLKKFNNKEAGEETALKLLICFMELSEMIKLRYDLCEMQDLINHREKEIKENHEKMELSQMTEEEKLKKFEKCEICENNMDMEKGECEVCQYRIEDFSFAYKFKELLEKKFHIIVKIPENQKNNDENETHDEPSLPKKHPALSKKIETKEEKSNEKWSCSQCTFVNDAGNLNCIICEAKRDK